MAKRSGRKGPGRKPPPRCKAILFCDRTLIEAGTNNVTLIGTFDRFIQRSFPGPIRPFIVFIQLTNGIGRYRTKIEIHDLKHATVLGRVEGEINFPEKLSKQNLMIHLPPLMLQHPGAYDVVLLADDQEIDRQQFNAVLLEEVMNDGDNEQEPTENDDD